MFGLTKDTSVEAYSYFKVTSEVHSGMIMLSMFLVEDLRVLTIPFICLKTIDAYGDGGWTSRSSCW